MTNLKWWQWLTMSNSALSTLGEDPNRRYQLTGHTRALSRVWARTVGMWGLCEAAEIMARAGKDPVRHRSAYDLFKNRHRLLTRRQFAKRLAKNTHGTVIIGYNQLDMACLTHSYIYEKVENAERVRKNSSDALMGALYVQFHEEYGILPIEAKLYYEAVDELLTELGYPVLKWTRLEHSARQELWDHGILGAGTKIEAPPELMEEDEHDEAQGA